LTQNAAFAKNHRQLDKFVANAEIHSFCEFHKFMIFYHSYWYPYCWYLSCLW